MPFNEAVWTRKRFIRISALFFVHGGRAQEAPELSVRANWAGADCSRSSLDARTRAWRPPLSSFSATHAATTAVTASPFVQTALSDALSDALSGATFRRDALSEALLTLNRARSPSASSTAGRTARGAVRAAALRGRMLGEGYACVDGATLTLRGRVGAAVRRGGVDLDAVSSLLTEAQPFEGGRGAQFRRS